jgi:hypothetical protein
LENIINFFFRPSGGDEGFCIFWLPLAAIGTELYYHRKHRLFYSKDIKNVIQKKSKSILSNLIYHNITSSLAKGYG